MKVKPFIKQNFIKKSFYQPEFFKNETFQFCFHFYGKCGSNATSSHTGRHPIRVVIPVVIPYGYCDSQFSNGFLGREFAIANAKQKQKATSSRTGKMGDVVL